MKGLTRFHLDCHKPTFEYDSQCSTLWMRECTGEPGVIMLKIITSQYSWKYHLILPSQGVKIGVEKPYIEP